MLTDEPELHPHLTHVWEAYRTVERSRLWGFGFPQPIQLSEILAYGAVRGIHGEDLEELVGFIRHLDVTYQEWFAEEQKKKAPKRNGRT